jgi:hypothetical protein
MDLASLLALSGKVRNASLSDEAKFRLTWSHVQVQARRAHEKRSQGTSGLAAQVPKIGTDRGGAIRVRDLIRQIATEHELEVISGKAARDHAYVFLRSRRYSMLKSKSPVRCLRDWISAQHEQNLVA